MDGLYILRNDTPSDIDDDKPDIPTNYHLSQNYPNPFNLITTISYHIPIASLVSLKVYGTTGQLVATLVDEYKNADRYSITWNAGNLSSGVYYYIIKAGNFTEVRKSILLK